MTLWERSWAAAIFWFIGLWRDHCPFLSQIFLKNSYSYKQITHNHWHNIYTWYCLGYQCHTYTTRSLVFQLPHSSVSVIELTPKFGGDHIQKKIGMFWIYSICTIDPAVEVGSHQLFEKKFRMDGVTHLKRSKPCLDIPIFPVLSK